MTNFLNRRSWFTLRGPVFHVTHIFRDVHISIRFACGYFFTVASYSYEQTVTSKRNFYEYPAAVCHKKNNDNSRYSSTRHKPPTQSPGVNRAAQPSNRKRSSIKEGLFSKSRGARSLSLVFLLPSHDPRLASAVPPKPTPQTDATKNSCTFKKRIISPIIFFAKKETCLAVAKPPPSVGSRHGRCFCW